MNCHLPNQKYIPIVIPENPRQNFYGITIRLRKNLFFGNQKQNKIIYWHQYRNLYIMQTTTEDDINHSTIIYHSFANFSHLIKRELQKYYGNGEIISSYKHGKL